MVSRIPFVGLLDYSMNSVRVEEEPTLVGVDRGMEEGLRTDGPHRSLCYGRRGTLVLATRTDKESAECPYPGEGVCAIWIWIWRSATQTEREAHSTPRCPKPSSVFFGRRR